MCIKTGGLPDREIDRKSPPKKRNKKRAVWGLWSKQRSEDTSLPDLNWPQSTHTFRQTPALANSLVCRCNTGRCSQPWNSFPLCPKTPFIQLGQQMKGIMGVNSERNVLTWHGVAWQLGRRLFKCRTRTESVIRALQTDRFPPLRSGSPFVKRFDVTTAIDGWGTYSDLLLTHPFCPMKCFFLTTCKMAAMI